MIIYDSSQAQSDFQDLPGSSSSRTWGASQTAEGRLPLQGEPASPFWNKRLWVWSWFLRMANLKAFDGESLWWVIFQEHTFHPYSLGDSQRAVYEVLKREGVVNAPTLWMISGKVAARSWPFSWGPRWRWVLRWRCCWESGWRCWWQSSRCSTTGSRAPLHQWILSVLCYREYDVICFSGLALFGVPFFKGKIYRVKFSHPSQSEDGPL